MAKKVTKTFWEDDFGNLHETEALANANSLEAKKNDIIYKISDCVYAHMTYDEFESYDFIVDKGDYVIGLLEAWNKLNER